ncbi:TRAP transporter small permease subunit [Cohaesibacter gelatinilyticus]|uniref:TRAP transporter small permease protein n=1 Tax=Cohaesibacter gelatinilyticus TaxID=372072 RepID=A0A285PNC6_9HYPH|nr:TRAP transporter small permease [Cohaesibacter gelatinilyticus]SNZ21636.1 TRAP-type mannitol/chloroaromatic compound transport system, small permease component [Cohaesibacter gelatinilyticus]HAT86216.1 TRAP transporter small permease [Hyphomicrobiales bacterium]
MAGHSSAVAAHSGNNAFLKIVERLSTLAGWASAAMIVIAVAITCQMIVVRFVLNGSTVWQTEAVIYLVIASTLIGLPYVQRLRGHVNVDLIPISLSPGPRFILAILTLFLSILIVLVMVFYGWEYWAVAWDRGWRSDTVWGVRLWIPYLAIPVGFTLLLLQLIADFVALILCIDKPFGLEDV